MTAMQAVKMKKSINRDSLLKTIARFDDNRSVEDVTDSGKSRKHVEPHTVLLQVLIEEICGCFEPDKNRRMLLFNEIYKHLGEAQFIDTSIELDGLVAQRYALARNFHQYIETLQRKITLPPLQSEITFMNFPDNQHDMSNIYQVNRYNQTFEEHEIIARGGYGVVCKAKHKVDGVIYAVKKVAFKYKNDPEFLKVLREVKSIAALKHPNVVSYNNAWVDIDLPSSSSSSKSSTKSSSQSSSTQSNSNGSSQENTSDSSGGMNATLKGYDKPENAESFSVEFEERADLTKLQCTELSGNVKSVYTNQVHFEDTQMHGRNKEDACSCDSVYYNDLLDKNGSIVHVSEMKQINNALALNSIYKIPDKINPYVEKISTVSSYENFSEFTDVNFAGIRNSIVKTESCKSRTVSLSSVSTTECKALLPVLKKRPWSLSNLNVKSTLFIQMEYCDCDLRHWLDQRSKETELPFEMNVMDIFKQILNGVAHIHFKSIIHRDLKPKNVFFSKEHRVMKIGDFGLSTLVECASEGHSGHILIDGLSAGLGTVPYAAPEQRRKHKYDCKVDIYSLGIILIELLSNFTTKMEFSIAVEEILKGKFPEEVVKNWPNHIDLVKMLTKKNPNERPSAKEILEFAVLRDEKQECDTESIDDCKKLVDNLRGDLLQKDLEIEHLKKLLKEKEELINTLQIKLQKKNCEIENNTNVVICSQHSS